MSGSVYGKLFKITTWGESHGKGLGVVIDGCPAGIPLTEEDIQIDLDRRKPGSSEFTTKRNEDDAVQIFSGVYEGKTTGTPISLIMFNKDQRSHDYNDIASVFRPGHADYGYDMKYGFRDPRGGGRSSGRETAARVAAGAVARKILAELNIDVWAYTLSIGDVSIDPKNFDANERLRNTLFMPDKNAFDKAAALLRQSIEKEDSVGGVVQCIVTGLKPGIGEPVFEKLDAALGQAIFSIGAVKALEFGVGTEAAALTGSQNNDHFYFDNGVKKYTNHAGGILGGLSDGADLVLKATFKPTSSIGQRQRTINQKNENVEIAVSGRHDPIIVARAVIVVEAMTAITLVDYIFQNMVSRMDTIKKLYF